MNRIDRLHAILTHLQSKRKVTARQLADRFSISLRTVYRDVKALEESGVPVIGEAGTGYTIMEGYRLPPIMFTQEEAAAILIGSKLTQRMTDSSVQKHFEDALYKIQSVLRTADKEYVEQLLPNVEVAATRISVDEGSNKHLAFLQKAVAEKKVIAIRYQTNADEVTDRQVEPVGLWYYGNQWHLIAWCRMRHDYRDFRISRIVRLQLKEEVFVSRSYESLKDYISQSREQLPPLQEMRVLMDKKDTRYLGDSKYHYGFVKQEDIGKKTRLTFLYPFPEFFGRWLLMFTNSVTIESPDVLKKVMSDLVTELKGHYQQK